MRNAEGAVIYSPFYEEGVGTIYFDAVNVFVNAINTHLVLEIATNVTAAAVSEGIAFDSALSDYGKMDWKNCPFDLFTVEGANLTEVDPAATNVLLESTAGGAGLFYRIRANLDYRNPIRFRIRRLDKESGGLDNAGLVLIDNVIASYPPMTAEICRYGMDFDTTLSGAEVLGCIGDFTSPFLAFREAGVKGHAFVQFHTNAASENAVSLVNTRMVYRWRYLNQVVGSWTDLPFDQTSIDSITFTTSNLVTAADIPLTNGVGDIEYYFTAEVDAPYYKAIDYAFDEDKAVGYGVGWTEQISAVTNRAVYATTPAGGTDCFARVREGASDVEWAKLVGTLTVTNTATGSNDVIGEVNARMALAGDHLWRYHYAIPTNGAGATLTFRIVAKEHYTNSTDAAAWHVRTNTFKAADALITELPYTATLDTGNPYDMKVVLDDSSTHLKIEYNDEQRAFAFSHASYQNFNLWSDAVSGFVGNMMVTNGTDVVSDSGVSGSKIRYDAPFSTNGAPSSTGWIPASSDIFSSTYWRETFTSLGTNGTFAIDEWFSEMKTPDNGWTARNGRFVQNSRASTNDMAFAMDGLGEGTLINEKFTADELPLGVGTVSFTGRISQPVEFDSFATYMDGLSLKNYAVSAKVSMSQDYEAGSHKSADMSPIHPSVSLVGYHRQKQGCYEFRMTRTSDDSLTVGLYKWTKSGSKTRVALLTEKTYSAKLWPVSTSERNNSAWTSVYFLVYKMDSGYVRLEGHISPNHNSSDMGSNLSSMTESVINYVDRSPGNLANGGTFGVGSTDCRAGFGMIRLHTDITTKPTTSTDATISANAAISVTKDQLGSEWDYYDTRWEVANSTAYANGGCLMSVLPTNQTLQVWLMDVEASNGWEYFGDEVVVNSFTTNRYPVAVRRPGIWKVKLQTSEEDDAGVVVDNVQLTAWEGLNIWGRDTVATEQYNTHWAYTKAWVTNRRVRVSAGVYTNYTDCVLQPSRGRAGYPMGLRSPYIAEGLSLFSFSYRNANSNCVLLVQIATNMTPRAGTDDVRALTTLEASDARRVWTTVDRHDFSTETNLAYGTRTTFISLRQHLIYDDYVRATVNTNVCGLIRVIVDPAVISKVAAVSNTAERADYLHYGEITLTEAHCYNEPALDLKSWFGWNVYTAGWDGDGDAGRFAYLTDYPDGLSLALNFSALKIDNDSGDAQGIGLADNDSAGDYAQQNPFVQCAALTNGIGTVSFRARLFDTNATKAVVTLYGGTDPGVDQPTTESRTWTVLTNFVVTSPTYQPFEFSLAQAESPYQAVRLSAAAARWGRNPTDMAADWEWGDAITPKQKPINRVFIDEMSASELIVPRLKFLDVRPFRTNLGTEDVCVITNIASADQQPLTAESWGIQCRVEPQQMSDSLDKDSIKVFMEVYRGTSPWGYEQWKNVKVDGVNRFSSQLARVPGTLVYRSHYSFPDSVMAPEETANIVYQYVVRAEYTDNSNTNVMLAAKLTSKDWTVPYWYRGSSVGSANASGDPDQFAAYTILDAISPRRAWVNEINYTEGDRDCTTNQFMELAVPQAADLKGWWLTVTTHESVVAYLATLGVSDGVRDLLSKKGSQMGEDFTNHYTFVSICSPSSRTYGDYDGYWDPVTTNGVSSGMLNYGRPYGIQLIRPSGIIEHEFVVEGYNFMADYPTFAGGFSGTNLVAKLRAADPSSQWFFAGEDLTNSATSLGVWYGHGEEAVPNTWTNYMYQTPGRLNKLKDGTLQEIDANYFLEPNGTNVWIYSYLADGYVKQFYGGRDMGASAVIIVPANTETNIVLSVTNWYQVGVCTTNGGQVAGMRGATGTNIVLNLGKVDKTTTIVVGTEPQNVLAESWGLTADNRYTTAVLDWLRSEYGEYTTNDLGSATYRNFAKEELGALTLTEMYWLNIPPVNSLGGSNIWYVAGSGKPDWLPGDSHAVVEADTTTYADGKVISNYVYMTVTMMMTNTATGAVWSPDRFNGLDYDGKGSMEYTGRMNQSWTSVVFNVEGALNKADVIDKYQTLRQFVFTADSFGAADSDHPFQTRVKIGDPYISAYGISYDWSDYRANGIFYRWTINSKPDGRVSIPPLVPNWSAVTNMTLDVAAP